MKLLVAFLTIVVLSHAAPSNRDLSQDFQKIIDLIPIDDMLEVVRRFNAEDAEFQEIVEYLRGTEWHELVDNIGDNEIWQRFKEFMFENGINVDAIIEAIHDFIEGHEHDEHINRKSKEQRSLSDFVDEILRLVNLEEILITINDLLNTSASFQEFFATISGPESRELVEQVRAILEVQRIAQSLRDRQIDIDAALAFVFELLGWE